MTPFILAVIRSTSLGSDACFDLMRIALDDTTVEIALRPAARIVSPDSTRSTMPSATPSAQAASTLPPTYLMMVFSFALPSDVPLVAPPACSASSFLKYSSARFVKLVTTFFPIRSSGLPRLPFAGTWTCSAHLPKSRSRTSSTPVVAVGGTTHSCSATWSRPVMPRSTRPSPTNVGMSAAGRKTSASGRFLTSAMSRREWRLNWMSEPERRSRHAWWSRPSVAGISYGLVIFVLVKLHILLGTANSNRSFKLWPRMSVKAGRLLLPWRGLVSPPQAPFVPFASWIEPMATQVSRE